MIRVNSAAGKVVKRTVDIVASALGIIILSPVFAVIGVAILVESPGPVFFRQVRIGRYGRPFRIWKFRSMRAGAEVAGPGVTVRGDLRITPLGGHLRRAKLDELPQLINVFLGDMSLVGPRPEIPGFVEGYSEEQRAVLQTRPGITDPASLRFSDEEALLARARDAADYYQRVVIPEKVALNIAYQRDATILSDLGVVWRTVTHLFGI